MDTQTQLANGVLERRKPRSKSKNFGWYVYLLAIGVLLAIGYSISTQKLYKPGDNLGYNIGLAGGIMMLTLLLYPLRKRAGFMKRLGILPTWFKWHMIFGILGPTLIMYHSTFVIRSINAGVAMFSMLLVAGSGVFGRFFYTKIHHGLYGRQASMRELQVEVEQTGDLQSKLGFVPDIQQKLVQFHRQASENMTEGKIKLLSSIMIGVRSSMLFWSLKKALRRAMWDKAGANVQQQASLEKLYNEYANFIHTYLKAVRDVSQFHTYQELFSWWHILHIPLVYMLVFSAIFHVISVHMY
jgi:hypothetical protein